MALTNFFRTALGWHHFLIITLALPIILGLCKVICQGVFKRKPLEERKFQFLFSLPHFLQGYNMAWNFSLYIIFPKNLFSEWKKYGYGQHSFFQAEKKCLQKLLIRSVQQILSTDQAAPNLLTIPLNKLSWVCAPKSQSLFANRTGRPSRTCFQNF